MSNQRTLGRIIGAIIDGETDKAIGMLVRLQFDLDRETNPPPMEAVNPTPKTKSLSKFDKQPRGHHGGQPIKHACPTCHAVANEPCKYMTNRGPGATVDETKGYKPDGQLHKTRGR